MPIRNMTRIGLAAAVVIAVSAGVSAEQRTPAGTPTFTDEAPFLTENAKAMDKMMADMEAKPTGDIDADFTAMMIPHHQGAIDMAVAYLRYGKNEQLRRLAQEIIVEQQQEIAAMRLALGQPPPPSAPAPTQPEAEAASPPTSAGHDHSATSHHAMPMSSAEKSK